MVSHFVWSLRRGTAREVRLSGAISEADKKTAFLLALAFEPFLIETLVGGQISSIGFLCLRLAIYQEQHGKQFLSGLFVSLRLYKPTILVVLLPMLVFSRRGRILGGGWRRGCARCSSYGTGDGSNRGRQLRENDRVRQPSVRRKRKCTSRLEVRRYQKRHYTAVGGLLAGPFRPGSRGAPSRAFVGSNLVGPRDS